jgi:hypothetical protein
MASISVKDGAVGRRRLELTHEWEGTYPARPRHVRDAQHAVEGFLAGCAAGDETLLICSELTTNSVLHSRSKLSIGCCRHRHERCVGGVLEITVGL